MGHWELVLSRRSFAPCASPVLCATLLPVPFLAAAPIPTACLLPAKEHRLPATTQSPFAPLAQILGPEDLPNILRLQLARMAPSSRLRQHVDTGGYAEQGHRIHVVLQTNPGKASLEGAATCPGPPNVSPRRPA